MSTKTRKTARKTRKASATPDIHIVSVGHRWKEVTVKGWHNGLFRKPLVGISTRFIDTKGSGVTGATPIVFTADEACNLRRIASALCAAADWLDAKEEGSR